MRRKKREVRKGKLYELLVGIAAVLLMLTACSTQKNTWASRSFHQTKVKYNIFYNGNLAFEDGLRAINTANEDDYSSVLPLYPVSNHTAAAAATSQMDKTIEKCRKCIKLHSIKSKPKPNPKKSSDPAYKLWLKQEEFNKEMGNAWIRLGEAEFHKGDFLGCIGTFSYVSRHYTHDADMIARCGLWTARAYAELGWLYEAQDVLSKVEVDALSRKHSSLYSAVSADILLKNKQYHEALPFVKIALPQEKRTVYRPRFQYVLAQLYEQEGKRDDAREAYKRVIRLSPAPEMEFNARLRYALLQGRQAVKKLLRMTRQSKNKDVLDQIYGAVGTIYLQAGDTVKALENFQLGIEKSTQSGLAKAAILVTAADLYYEKRDYVAAQPLYAEATTILPVENENYDRLQKRSQTLNELIVEYSAVQLQDSLQRLSHMTEEEQRAVVDKLIENLIKAEKEAEEKALLEAREAEHGGLQSVDTRNMLGGGGQAAEWYFYNQQLLRSGKQDFVRRWGTRPLEDNWRRLSKTAVSSFLPTSQEDEDLGLESDSIPSDSLQSAIQAPETDIHKPEYYLQQIPTTEEDIAASDSIIARALYNMVYIYQEKVGDQQLAGETLSELERRFPTCGYLLDLYYMKYLEAVKQDDSGMMSTYRSRIVTLFPDSKQARIVSDPLYFDRLRHMAREQDSLYQATYEAYSHSRYMEVKSNKRYAEEAYPLSPLLPRFLFLNAIAVARTEGQDAFVGCLRELVSLYPQSELSAMGKDMLAMMGQGMESQTGGTTSSLASLRETTEEDKVDEEMADKSFSRETKTSSFVYLVLPDGADEQQLNSILYQVALFNFSQFLIRDFELQALPVFGSSMALRVSGLESLDEARWYIGLMEKNEEVKAVIKQFNLRLIPITEENSKLLHTRFSEQEYEEFLVSG